MHVFNHTDIHTYIHIYMKNVYIVFIYLFNILKIRNICIWQSGFRFIIKFSMVRSLCEPFGYIKNIFPSMITFFLSISDRFVEANKDVQRYYADFFWHILRGDTQRNRLNKSVVECGKWGAVRRNTKHINSRPMLSN